MPSPEQTEKINNRIGILSNPQNIIKEGQSGKRHGPAQWQYDHWQAKDATTGKDRGCKSIEYRWITDILQVHRYLKTINVDNVANWDEKDCSYCGIKTEITMERCQSEMISNLQPDHLLWPATREVKDISTFLEVDEWENRQWHWWD